MITKPKGTRDTPEYGVCFLFVNRLVRTRMPGGVGRAG